MPWSFEKSTPVYVQIADMIRKRIVCGFYARASQLPSVRDFAIEAAVNPNTMQRALSGLEAEGLIETRGTQGRYVTDSDEIISAARRGIAQQLIKNYFGEMQGVGIDASGAAELAVLHAKEMTDCNG